MITVKENKATKRRYFDYSISNNLMIFIASIVLKHVVANIAL